MRSLKRRETMDWGWRFLTEWEVLIVLANLIWGTLVVLLIQVSSMRREIRNLLINIKYGVKK